MKRIVITTILAATLLTGCTPAPEKTKIAIPKDVEQMVQTAQSGVEQISTQATLAERFVIPKEYSAAFEGVDGKLKINVDADIELPQVNKIPIVRVAAANFTQDQVDSFFNAFCKDKEMYEQSDKLTKTDIKGIIEGYNQNIYHSKFGDVSEKQKNEWQKDVENLEKLMETAPNEHDEWRTNGKLREITRYWELSGKPIYKYAGINAYDKNKTLSFSVENNNDLKAAFVTHEENGVVMGGIPVRRGAMLHYFQNRDYTNAHTDDVYVPIIDENTVPEECKNSLTITPAQAKEICSKLINGMGMKINEILYFDPKNEVGGKSFYKLYCVREINGVSNTYLYFYSSIAQESLSPRWNYETLSISIDDDGIFFFSWTSPLEIKEFVTQDANLLPFKDIESVFEKIITVHNSPEIQADNNIKHKEIKVSHITLTLQRVSDYGSIENGLLIPVWNFYGETTREFYDGEETAIDDYNSIGQKSLMTINAIDGTVIDLYKGY